MSSGQLSEEYKKRLVLVMFAVSAFLMAYSVVLPRFAVESDNGVVSVEISAALMVWFLLSYLWLRFVPESTKETLNPYLNAATAFILFAIAVLAFDFATDVLSSDTSTTGLFVAAIAGTFALLGLLGGVRVARTSYQLFSGD